MKEKFSVKLLEDAKLFLDAIDEKVREKIVYIMNKAKFSNDNELFKKLKEEIREFRTLYSKTYYRLFAFWDKSGTVVTLVI
ncbi:MAG: type II toxin-antitoxin system RelE/ParE family toxin [Bacteroidales bacterium]